MTPCSGQHHQAADICYRHYLNEHRANRSARGSSLTNICLTSIGLQFRKGSNLKWGARLQGEVRSPHDLSIAPNLSHSLLFLYPYSHFNYDIYLAVCLYSINAKSQLADSPSEQDPDQNNKVSSNLDFYE
jgi:hypothetical protein